MNNYYFFFLRDPPNYMQCTLIEFSFLADEQLTIVRQYIEIFAMQLYLKFPSMVSHISVIMLTYKDLALAYKSVWIRF